MVQYAAHAPSLETIVAPSGCSGVQRVPNAWHSCGFISPCSTSPLMHSAGSGRGPTALRSNRRSASNSAYSGRSPRPLRRISPMPRHARSTTSNTSADERLGRPVARLGHDPRVLILDLRPALLELREAHVDALQEVERLEAGDDDRHAVAGGDREVLAVAHHGADVAGREESLHAARRATTRIASSAGGTSTCDTRRLKLPTPCCFAWYTAIALPGRRRLEADREEHDLPVRVLRGRSSPRRAASRRCARRRRPP